jgi:hypothetical protein
VVLGEICYQIVLQGFNGSVIKYKKRIFIPYGFQLGYYFVNDTTRAKQEGLSHVEYKFDPGILTSHDTKILLPKHAK